MTDKRKEDMQNVSELLRQGKSRKEIESIIKHDKGWISRIIKEMRDEAPELLKGTAEAKEEKQGAAAPDQKQTLSSVITPKKPIEAPKKQEHTETQMLSFRANTDDIRRWKAYTQVKRITATELYTAAINAYLEDNPLLTEKEVNAFDSLMALDE